MISIFSSHLGTKWLFPIALLLFQPKLIWGIVCGTCEDDCPAISSEECMCFRVVHKGFNDEIYVRVKCSNFKEPYAALTSNMCPEGKCIHIEFVSSNITTLPKNFFQQNPYFLIVLLNDAEIQNLQEGAFTNLPSLRYLSLKNNKIKNIKTGCFNTLTRLLELDLHENLIENIDKNALLDLVSLRMLDLSRNQLISLPKELFTPLKKLRTLILSNNHLKTIDFDLDGLKNLENLYLNHNKIITLGTCLKTISLNSLYLQNNEIQKMNESCLSTQLSILNIANNQIDNLNFLQGARSLISLNISSNRIGKIEIGTFRNLGSLRKLDLSHNEISQLKMGIFSNLERLDYLNLSSTKLKDLDSHIFEPLTSLTILDVSENDINYWDAEVFNHFNNFQKFCVQGNNFTCDVVSSLFLQSKQKNFSLIYDTDYSIENFKGFPCISGHHQQHHLAENETKPNEMTNLSREDLREFWRNISSLLGTNCVSLNKMQGMMKDLEENIQGLKDLSKNISSLLGTNKGT